MNQKPQTQRVFSWLAALTAFAVTGGAIASFAAATVADESTAAVDSAANTTIQEGAPDSSMPDEKPAGSDNLPRADDILTEVRTKLENLDSLQCDLTQTAMIAGMKMQAAGKYVEASGNRVRLQFIMAPMVTARAEDAKALALDAAMLELEEADDRGLLIQVSDGGVLYTSWKNGKETRVSRRSIREILNAAAATTDYDPRNAAMDLGVGGLRGLISRLQTTMDFAMVKSVKAGDRDLYEVTGRWSEKVRKEIFQIPEGTLADPRPHVPEYCRIYVDVQTMLPRRIQFLKRNIDVNLKLVRPMITLDLRNIVLNETIDDQVFTFTAPEGAVEEDVTQDVINLIQRTTTPPESQSTEPAGKESEVAPK